jgi:hypothetical protein
VLLVVLVKADQRLADTEVGKELGRTAGILGDHAVTVAESSRRTDGQVTKIPDRRGDQRQGRKNLFVSNL